MKIKFFEIGDGEQAVLTELLEPIIKESKAEVEFSTDKLGIENVADAQGCEIISVFINSVIKQDVLDKLPQLKFITTRSTGFDHIDTAYAKSKGVVTCNVPAYGSRTVAEFAFALMLGLSRKTFLAYHQVKENHDFDFSHFKGFNLMGKTLGIVGTGRIGLNVAEMAINGFKMKVLATDPYPNQKKAQELGFAYLGLEELLPKCDIVSIHVPYMKSTHHLINESNIRLFKPGALLVNTARGEIVKTEALLLGLKEKILAGVGLDVLEGERELKEEWTRITGGNELTALHSDQIKTLLEDHMLIDYPQVAITPHIAFFTDEAKREIMQTTTDNISGYLKQSLVNVTK
ncbi:MAG: NAD(P)-dependent oxidoreductase [Acidobacteriaceae bacterium]